MSKSQAAEKYLNHPVSAGFGKSGGSRARLRRWLVGQFGKPTGFWGRVAGWIMANRRSNIERNLWSVELLEIGPAHRVLEIGFGPGISLEAIARRLATGHAVGIDHSEVMRKQAARRVGGAIAEGRVTLLTAGPADLPPDSGPFHRMLAVNVVMFWADPVETLRGLKASLVPGGRIALTMQPRSPKATDADARRAGELLCAQLREAGYRNVRLETRPMAPVAAVCALGER